MGDPSASAEVFQDSIWRRHAGDIPLAEGTVGDTKDGAAQAQASRMRQLIESQTRRLGTRLTPWLDTIVLRWLRRTSSPYAAELSAIADKAGVPGVALLNLWQEWGCTSGVLTGSDVPTLHRVFDWQMVGLGECLVALARQGTAGPSLSLTWPYFVGDLTVQCPGRFAAALNQAPFQRRSLCGVAFPEKLDWLCDLREVSASTGMPPSHLLRLVADQAAGFEQAVQQLSDTPLCRGAIFIVAGANEGEGAVIERLPSACAVRRDALSAANHWLNPDWPGKGRPDSRPREQAMQGLLAANACDPADLVSPILNDRTRYAASLNAASGDVTVQRIEGQQAFGVTSRFGMRRTNC